MLTPEEGSSEPAVPGTQVLGRALTLLDFLHEQPAAVTVGDLAAGTRLPVSNVYRLVQVLEYAGLVDRDTRGRVQPGLRLIALGNSVTRRVGAGIVPVADPVMRELTAEVRQTSVITMRTGLSALCVHTVESPEPIRLSFTPGRLLPLTAGASGRVLLPWLPDRLAGRVLARHEASGAGMPVAALRESTAAARKAGYLVTDGEIDTGATAVAAPVLLPGGRLWAGLSVAGPRDQFTGAGLQAKIEAVRTYAARLAAAVVDAGPRP